VERSGRAAVELCKSLWRDADRPDLSAPGVALPRPPVEMTLLRCYIQARHPPLLPVRCQLPYEKIPHVIVFFGRVAWVIDIDSGAARLGQLLKSQCP